jgi:hypothetical protein
MLGNITLTEPLVMLEDAVRDGLLLTLAEHYENNPREFCRIPRNDLASALFREAVAGLRNEGYVEEEIRGVIRFTERGYKAYRAGVPITYFCKTG